MPLRSHEIAPSGAFFRLQMPALLLVFLVLLGCPLASRSALEVPSATSGYVELSRDATWLRLLHYQGGVIGNTRSAIHSPEFFLDPQGSTDAAAELSATVRALHQPVVVGGEDDHAACRFPARRQWLETRISGLRNELQSVLKDLSCPAFVEWGDPRDIDSISLMFANGYLGNPASYYGHLFLKFNSKKSGQSYLLDKTENFGALDVKGDNPVQYIVKALVGGYDGGFSQIDFFYHDATYTENEFRDLWEYRLDLAPEEVRFLSAHAWEIHRKRYTYFFFHDNCAFRVAEVLELLKDVKAVPTAAPWVIPQEVVKVVANQSRYGKPFVKERRLHPSRQSRLYQGFNALNGEQQALVQSIAVQRITLSDPSVKLQPEADQARMADTLLDYYQFTSGSTDAGSEKKLPEAYFSVLKARFDLPPAATAPKGAVADARDAPDVGRSPGWVQIGLGSQEGAGPVQTLRIRPAYYDDLDSDAAQAPWSGLSMGDLTLERQSDTVQVKKLDFVAINSNRPSMTRMPGDGGTGWTARFGLEKQSLACTDCLVFRLQGDYRKVMSLPIPNSILALGLGGGVQSNRNNEGMALTSVLLKLSKRFQNGSHVNLSQETKVALDRSESTRHISTLEWRTPISRALDWRLLWERDGVARTTFGFGAYW